MNRLSLYLGHRAKLLHNIKHELDSPKDTLPEPTMNMIDLQDKSAEAMKSFHNIQEMISKVSSGGLLPDQSDITQLRNPFTGKLAIPEQQQDMLNFRKTGQQEYEVYIEYCYLKVSSVEQQMRRRKVNTFSDQKASRQLTDTERDKKTVSMCHKKCLHAIAQGFTCPSRCEQYLKFPRAICNSDGTPYKGEKKIAREFLKRRYQLYGSQTDHWFPDTLLLEGMFMIYTIPLPNSTMLNYGDFLLTRYTTYYLHRGVQDIHIIFDHPGRLADHPKCIEQNQRDKELTSHTHTTFSDTQKVPKKWNELLQCRECKRYLVTYLGDCFLRRAPALLQGNQKMYVSRSNEGAKADKAYYATTSSTYNEEPTLESNAEEADTRVWMHVVKSSGRRVLIYSPDTDVLHIGLLVANTIIKDIRIQTSPLGKPRKVLSSPYTYQPMIKCIQ